jgi:hypothetical protein
MDNRDRDRDFGDEDRMTLDDPLGIAQEPVSKDSSIRASYDEDSVRRRRRRALGDDEPEVTNGLGELDGDPDGVSGIDMGYGGEGTDIKPSR